MADRPIRPTNARIVKPGGEVVPLELVYCGCKDGMHRWSGAAVFDPDHDELLVDTMPAHTGITLPFKKSQDKEGR